MNSAAMKPYMDLAKAAYGGKETAPALEALAALPLEQRCVWRVASALKWAFTDLELLSVEADRETLTEHDRNRLAELLAERPLQFCMFLSALIGQKPMEIMILTAIKNSRLVAAQSEGEQQS